MPVTAARRYHDPDDEAKLLLGFIAVAAVAGVGYICYARLHIRASLIGIPRLEITHIGNKISFGSSGLTALAQTLVETDPASEADWIAAEKTPSTLVEHVLRSYLADRGQSTIAEHFELSLTLGEAIVDSVYGEAEPTSPGQLFLVLNTESSFALGVGDAITELEDACAGMGQAFYHALRQ